MRQLRHIFILFILMFAHQAVAESPPHYTLNEAAARIQKETGEQILSADVVDNKQGKYYRFKVKKKGRVRVVLIRPDGTRVK